MGSLETTIKQEEIPLKFPACNVSQTEYYRLYSEFMQYQILQILDHQNNQTYNGRSINRDEAGEEWVPHYGNNARIEFFEKRKIKFEEVIFPWNKHIYCIEDSYIYFNGTLGTEKWDPFIGNGLCHLDKHPNHEEMIKYHITVVEKEKDVPIPERCLNTINKYCREAN